MTIAHLVTPLRTSGDRCPGAVRLHEAADGLLARIRIPGGLLTADQVVALADAATTLGDGAVSLTARGNVEIRGLGGPDVGDRLTRLVGAAGLVPSVTHERVRNIVVSPAAGLDGAGHAGSLVDVVRTLDRLLCSSPRAADLSGRFLFGLDDGRGDVLALRPDLAARWTSPTEADLHVGDTPVLTLRSGDVPEALLIAAVAFLDARDNADETAWRVADLASPEAVVAAVTDAVADRLPRSRRITSPAPQPSAEMPAPGLLGDDGVNLVLRLGRAPAATWIALASLARSADGLLRTTPARGIVLAGLDPQVRAQLLLEARALGLIADPADPAHRVTACTGLPGCASSRADVHADVEAALSEVMDADDAAAADHGPIHVSGCERRCGHPRHEHHEAVARPPADRTAAAGFPASARGTTSDEDAAADESAYATALVDGSPATGAPLGVGEDALVTLLTARRAPS